MVQTDITLITAGRMKNGKNQAAHVVEGGDPLHPPLNSKTTAKVEPHLVKQQKQHSSQSCKKATTTCFCHNFF